MAQMSFTFTADRCVAECCCLTGTPTTVCGVPMSSSTRRTRRCEGAISLFLTFTRRSKAIFHISFGPSRGAAFKTRTRCARSYGPARSEEHTSELQSLMRISYAVFCLKKKTIHTNDLLDDAFTGRI